MAKVTEEDLFKVVQVYNDAGRAAAYDFLRSQYDVKNPYFVIKRIGKNPKFEYNEADDSYLLHKESDVAGVFMSMEELCSPVIPLHVQTSEKQFIDNRSAEMEKLIHELLGERLLELSRYITLDSSSKTMLIDQTSLKCAGYLIIMN